MEATVGKMDKCFSKVIRRYLGLGTIPLCHAVFYHRNCCLVLADLRQAKVKHQKKVKSCSLSDSTKES